MHVVEIPSFDDWPSVLGHDEWPVGEREGFALLLAADASNVDDAVIYDLATWCIEHGVFSVSLWGEACERVHDVFDTAAVVLELNKRDAGLLVAPSPVVMTSWHADDTIEEALHFFWNYSRPDAGLPDGPWRIVLVVADEAVATTVRRWATAPAT